MESIRESRSQKIIKTFDNTFYENIIKRCYLRDKNNG